MTSPPAAAASTTYRVVLPPGWVRIPLRDDPSSAVDDLLGERFAGLPTDRFGPLRKELRRRLLAQISTARDHEGLDLFLPVAERHGTAIPASFVVALLPFDTVETPEPEQVLVAYAAGVDDATVLELDGAPAVRTRRVEAGRAGATDGGEIPSVRVDYLVSVPGACDLWLTFSFATIGDGDPASRFTGVVVDLFDAIMGTLVWSATSDRSGEPERPADA
jgi:hypothetical protein